RRGPHPPMSSSPTEILLPNRLADVPRPAAVTDGEHPSLLVALTAVPDPRDPRGRRYPAGQCAGGGGVCGAGWGVPVRGDQRLVQDLDRVVWVRLGFTDCLPAATTVWRLLIRIDAPVLQAVLTRWLRARTAPVVIGGRRWRS